MRAGLVLAAAGFLLGLGGGAYLFRAESFSVSDRVAALPREQGRVSLTEFLIARKLAASGERSEDICGGRPPALRVHCIEGFASAEFERRGRVEIPLGGGVWDKLRLSGQGIGAARMERRELEAVLHGLGEAQKAGVLAGWFLGKMGFGAKPDARALCAGEEGAFREICELAAGRAAFYRGAPGAELEGKSPLFRKGFGFAAGMTGRGTVSKDRWILVGAAAGEKFRRVLSGAARDACYEDPARSLSSCI